MDNEIYTMELHQRISTDPYTQVVRVPGGWIYRFFQLHYHLREAQGVMEENYTIDSIFVPFTDEFQVHEKRKETS